MKGYWQEFCPFSLLPKVSCFASSGLENEAHALPEAVPSNSLGIKFVTSFLLRIVNGLLIHFPSNVWHQFALDKRIKCSSEALRSSWKLYSWLSPIYGIIQFAVRSTRSRFTPTLESSNSLLLFRNSCQLSLFSLYVNRASFIPVLSRPYRACEFTTHDANIRIPTVGLRILITDC